MRPDWEKATKLKWRRVGTSDMGSTVYNAPVPDGVLCLMVNERGPNGWYMSISHRLSISGPGGHAIPGRYPTWDEIAAARYEFIPDRVTMVMMLPPRSEYINVMPTCFHLHEAHDEGAALALRPTMAART